MIQLTRRKLLALSVASVSAPAIIRNALAASDINVRWASLQPGFTVLPVQYILANHLGRKNGIILPDPSPYTAVSTYYNDFTAGNYDICIGSWDTFAARYQAGVPLKYVCSITDANMIAMLAPKGGVEDVSKLKGRTIAALQSTGTYRIVRALIKVAFGFDMEKDATIQNVDNPAASVSLLMADRADAAISWEPNITTGLIRKPDLRVLLKAGDVYKKISGGIELPYFGVAIRKELADANPGIAAKISKMFEDCLAGINADTTKAADLFGSKTGIQIDVLKEAMSSRRLEFGYRPMSDELSRSAVMIASDFLASNGLLSKPIDENFFAV
ncbi:ABC transporter substrate-binding protein [Bradyrhizobium sp. Leo121]|uniref:ABC transporter substrate-binding protein n=1 Tax=Bradyrhizobium sp. Leo121 TaxID=1571195 RepID=UPI001028F564|nr:ABC transporter substrate-binding protein [Bradyrhizobium sp. Leo121]RZN32220.1 twin-arginine translocation pathway signal protein [Bradyrhizobium sp. Leo121]